MVLSTQDAEFLVDRRRIARDRVVRVNGGADESLLRAARAVPGEPRLLFVGSWIDRKGVPELCEAWRRLRLTHPDMRLTLAGTALGVDEVLRDIASEWRTGIAVFPSVDDELLHDLLTSHDIFVLPSWFEGMPLSMLEAAATGLACVVTSICGNLDVFRPADPRADGAILIPAHSADALVAAVEVLAADPDLRAQLGASARRRAASFTWDHTAEQLLDAYRAALTEDLSPRRRRGALAALDTPRPGAELEISVLIATWRRPTSLLRCLAAIDAQDHPAAEVIVVVRAEDAATWAALASVTLAQPVLRTVSVHVPGAVAALNAGMKAATGAIIAITDDDATPRADWLRRIDEHLQRRPDVAAVGGRDWVHPQSETQAGGGGLTVGRLLPFGRLVGNHDRGSGAAREVDALKGVNLALRRAALDAICLDERLRGSGAQVHWELGLCLALKQAGWQVIYDPAVAVDHYPAERFGDNQRESRALDDLAAEVHNEMYALLRWLPARRKAVALIYGVVVGSRRAPGVLVACERWAREGDGRAVGARLLTAQHARLDALRTVVRARHAAHPSHLV
jgi:GT2 family glycosyltransferase